MQRNLVRCVSQLRAFAYRPHGTQYLAQQFSSHLRRDAAVYCHRQQHEQVDLNPLFKGEILTPCDCANDAEEQLYVTYALELDDGEAMSLAIAHARSLPFATDEKKAKRVIKNNATHLRVLSTAEILYAWADGKNQAEVKTVLDMIGVRARFRPPDDDPLSTWWNSF